MLSFTILLGAVFLRDIPTPRQCTGMLIALIGLAIIGSTIGAKLKLIGLGLGVASAFSLAVGNVQLKRMSGVPMFPLVVWCSLVPPLPTLLVSSVYDRPLFEEPYTRLRGSP